MLELLPQSARLENVAVVNTRESVTETPKANRLAFLDGLRGLAALYVVIDHLSLAVYGLPGAQRLNPVETLFQQVFGMGHYAVALFIVLSGFSLMLPVARSEDGRLQGGFWGYIMRRARRILPPYYAALAVSLLLIAVMPNLEHTGGFEWKGTSPAWSSGSVISHLLLIHNLKLAWFLSINPAMWSIAVEWQIYFVFALLLLPVYRRFGLAGAAGASVIVSLWPRVLFHGNYDYTHPQFVGLFTLGMMGAVLAYPKVKPSIGAVRQRSWNAKILILCALTGIVALLRAYWSGSHAYFLVILADWIPGAAVVCLLVKLTEARNSSQTRSRWSLAALLEARPTVALGHFSYSLYLIHVPIIALLRSLLCAAHPDSSRGLFALLMLPSGMAFSLAGAYAFYCAFERPFLRQRASD